MEKKIKPKFFKTPADFRKWLEKNHTKKKELFVGFYKKASGKPSIIWQEAVEEALCFGWIDGRRNAVDEISFMNRFTPRKPDSNWSAINIATVKRLIASGKMTEAGLKLFNQRGKAKANGYMKLSQAFLKKLKSNKKAWAYFYSLAPSYRKITEHWVMSPKQEKTRLSHLEDLIKDSENHRKIKLLRGQA